MPKVELSTQRGPLVFKNREVLVNTLGGIIPPLPTQTEKGIKRRLRKMIDKGSNPTRREKQMYQDFGNNITVVLEKEPPHTYYVKLEETKHPARTRRDLLQAAILKNPSVERAPLAVNATISLASVEELTSIVSVIFDTVPFVGEIPIPEYYLNPPSEKKADADRDEEKTPVPQVNRFQITKNRDTAAYIPFLL